MLLVSRVNATCYRTTDELPFVLPCVFFQSGPNG
jgi:hypothetical protein